MRYVIVGAGFCGSIIARLIAEKLDCDVSIYEKRSHLAGNMYDEIDENGILVQRYGPHTFHTDVQRVYDFITKYGEWEPYQLTCKAEVYGKLLVSPFGYDAVDFLFDKQKASQVKETLEHTYPGATKVSILELLNSNNPLVKEYANILFEEDYKPYTAKQWGLMPDKIDKSVLERVPVYLSYKNGYFDDKYQCMPKNGFTSFFTNLLTHKNIKIYLNNNIKNHLVFDFDSNQIFFEGKKFNGKIVYTGALDELFDYEYGELPYRSLRFEYKTVNQDSFQDAPIVAYPKAEGYTRITEYKKLPVQKIPQKSTIAIEYPLQYKEATSQEPYYPIPTKENWELHRKYMGKASCFSNFYACGRLADYKYYNMDNAVERALDVFDKIKLEK